MRMIAFINEPRVVGQVVTHFAAKAVDARRPPSPGSLDVSRENDAA
jgi:hypothetical protein